LKISHVGLISTVYFQDLSIVFSFLLWIFWPLSKENYRLTPYKFDLANLTHTFLYKFIYLQDYMFYSSSNLLPSPSAMALHNKNHFYRGYYWWLLLIFFDNDFILYTFIYFCYFLH
jgi:hypothetical protein